MWHLCRGVTIEAASVAEPCSLWSVRLRLLHTSPPYCYVCYFSTSNFYSLHRRRSFSHPTVLCLLLAAVFVSLLPSSSFSHSVCVCLLSVTDTGAYTHTHNITCDLRKKWKKLPSNGSCARCVRDPPTAGDHYWWLFLHVFYFNLKLLKKNVLINLCRSNQISSLSCIVFYF